MKKKYAIGVDVGGSHISCATYDLHAGKFKEGTKRSLPINNNGSKEEIVLCFVELLKPGVEELIPEELIGIGVAMPGPFDYVNGIGLFSGENAKYVNLNQVNMRAELSNKLGIDGEKIRFINDATAFAMGEFFKGSLRGSGQSLSITLGTGFGAAFLSQGTPILYDARIPQGGYLWDRPFEASIADDYFSTRGLVERYEKASGIKVKGVKELADAYNVDKIAQATFHDFGHKLASFLKPWLKSFEVDALVIGGNVSRAFTLFEKPLLEALHEDGLTTKIGTSDLLEDAAFVGAAYLLNDKIFEIIKEQLKFM